jgi:hypothetical protein
MRFVKRNPMLFILGLMVAISLTACAKAHPEVSECIQGDKIKGFFDGLFHGFVAVPALIISLIDKTVAVWDVHNNGLNYQLGFLIGIGAFSSGASKVKKQK